MRAAFMAAGADAVTATNRAYAALFGMVAAAGGDGVVRRPVPAARPRVPRADSARAAHEAPGREAPPAGAH